MQAGDIDSNLLIPAKAWSYKDEYDSVAKNLVGKFQANFQEYDLGDSDIQNAGTSI